MNQKQQILDHLQKTADQHREREQISLVVCQAIIDTAEARAGKVLNKTFMTKVKENVQQQVPELVTWYWNTEYSTVQIVTWGGKVDYNNRLSITLGYQEILNQPIISVQISEQLGANGYHPEKIKAGLTALDRFQAEQLPQLVEDYLKVCQALEAFDKSWENKTPYPFSNYYYPVWYAQRELEKQVRERANK